MESFKTTIRRNTQFITKKPSSLLKKQNPSNLSTKSNFDSSSTPPSRPEHKTRASTRNPKPSTKPVPDVSHSNITSRKPNHSKTSIPAKSPFQTPPDLLFAKSTNHLRNHSKAIFPSLESVASPFSSRKSLKQASSTSVLNLPEKSPKNPSIQEGHILSKKKTKSISSAADISKVKSKRHNAGSLSIPSKNGIMSPDLQGLSYHIKKNAEKCKPIDSNLINENIKVSKQLAKDVKKCIAELRQEAASCANNRLSIKSALQRSKITFEHIDSAESENRISLTEKTPKSSDFLDNRPSFMEDQNINEMKVKIDTLMSQMSQSENEAKFHETENKKLKEIIKSLEHKIEDYRMYSEKKTAGCSGNCQVV